MKIIMESSYFLWKTLCYSVYIFSKFILRQPLTQPYTNLWGKQLCIYGLDTSHSKFDNTPEDKFQDQQILIKEILWKQVNNQQNKAWTKNLKDILHQAKQSFKPDKSEQPTSTLTKTIHKTVGEANLYVQFGYAPHKIC